MSLFGLFGPPNVKKLLARRDYNGLAKASNYKQDEKVQVQAAEALLEIGDYRAIQILVQTLLFNPKNWTLHDTICEGLLHIASPIVVDALTSAGANQRSILSEMFVSTKDYLVKIYARASDPRAIGLIVDTINAINDDDAVLKESTIDALGQIADPRIMDQLMAILNETRNPNAQEAAAGAIGRIGGSRATNLLIKILNAKHNLEAHEMGYAPPTIALMALEKVVESSAKDIETSLLQQISQLDNISSVWFPLVDGIATRTYRQLDCSKVKHMALEELSRRGVIE